MKKRIKPSSEAQDVINHLATKSLEEESFLKEIDTLLAKSDDEIKEGLGSLYQKGFSRFG